MKIISEEEQAKAVKDWIDQDYSVRSIQVNRGHWEDIAPVIAQAQLESDRKVFDDADTVWRQILRDVQTIHKTMIKEIFAELEGYHSGLDPKCFDRIDYPDIQKVDIQMTISTWQALKQKYLKGGK